MTTTEAAIDEVRESRKRMSHDCEHDPSKLIAYLKQYEHKHSSQILEYKKARTTKQPYPA